MEVKLIVVHGKHAGREIPILLSKFFMGRAEDCQLRVHNEQVSRHHCVVIIEEGYVAVRDFQSKNGTFVNGKRISDQTELKSGDRLQVGQIELEVRIGVAGAGKAAAEVSPVQEAAAGVVQATPPQPTVKDLCLGDRLDDAGDDFPGDDDTVTVFAANLTRPSDKAGDRAPAPDKSGGEGPKGANPA